LTIFSCGLVSTLSPLYPGHGSSLVVLCHRVANIWSRR
jgi:hypothetical protein